MEETLFAKLAAIQKATEGSSTDTMSREQLE